MNIEDHDTRVLTRKRVALSVLKAADAASPARGLRYPLLMDLMAYEVDAELVLRVLRDLASDRLIELRDFVTAQAADAATPSRMLVISITAQGSAVREGLVKHPLVDDPRKEPSQ